MTNAVSYYFTSNEVMNGYDDNAKGLYFALLEHCGSIAFGSGTRFFVTFIRVIIDSTTNNNKQNGGEGVIGSCLMMCCAGCLENFIDYFD